MIEDDAPVPNTFLRTFLLSTFRCQPSETEVIHNILHLLDLVFDNVTTLPQSVILQIEDLKASMDVLDELADQEWPQEVTKRDGIPGKARKFIQQGDQSQ